MNITIIGAGNGGLAFGATLIKQGISVNLFDKFPTILAPIIENNNCVTLDKDGRKETLQFSSVTDNLEDAIRASKYIFVVTPAFAHKEIAAELAKCIKKDQVIILNPGRTGGALAVKKILEEKGKSGVVVAETETLLYACRKTSATDVCIYGVKDKVGVASLPANAINKIINDLSIYFPSFFPYSNVLFTSLNNIGAIFHPTPFLLNIGKIESKESFKYYHEGISPFIASFLEKLDEERLSIAKKFGVQLPAAKEWVEKSYGLTGNSLYDAIQSNLNYKDIFAPLDINSRYVLEDIPMSLVPLAELARVGSIETQYMNTIIDLASALYKRDFRKEGRSLEEMGLVESIESIQRLANNHFSII